MIRCVQIWTASDGNSAFEEGAIDLAKGGRADAEGTTLREAALKSGYVDAATFDRVCDPRSMVGAGVGGA
jgi:fumarate hydratase class II